MLSMSDLRKIAKGEPLNEFTTAFPVTNKEFKQLEFRGKSAVKYTLQIRSQYGPDSSNDGKLINHGCAEKLYVGQQNVADIPIPTKPYSTLKPNSIYIKRLDMLDDDPRISNDAAVAIKSFIYQHQMDLIAYWYLTQEEFQQLDPIFEDYFENLLKNNNYSRNPYKRTEGKTAAELEQDKKEILDYVKSKAPSYNGSLYFGA